MTDVSLAGRRVLVTGAAGGIGAAVAAEVASSGAATLVLADRPGADLAAVTRTAEAAGATVVGLEADLADADAVVRLASEAVEAAGGVDVLVNAAGVHERVLSAETAVDAMSVDLWNLVLAVNLTAPWLLVRELAPVMARGGGGSIVNVASQLGLVGAAASPAYTTSKAGLVQLTRSAAVDLAPHGIRCNAVAPGAIETAMTDRILGSGPDPEGARRAALDTYVIQRFGEPHEVAAAVCFLASDASAWTTGSCLVVDGGQTAWR